MQKFPSKWPAFASQPDRARGSAGARGPCSSWIHGGCCMDPPSVRGAYLSAGFGSFAMRAGRWARPGSAPFRPLSLETPAARRGPHAVWVARGSVPSWMTKSFAQVEPKTLLLPLFLFLCFPSPFWGGFRRKREAKWGRCWISFVRFSFFQFWGAELDISDRCWRIPLESN